MKAHCHEGTTAVTFFDFASDGWSSFAHIDEVPNSLKTEMNLKYFLKSSIIFYSVELNRGILSKHTGMCFCVVFFLKQTLFVFQIHTVIFCFSSPAFQYGTIARYFTL